jgi:hypothetical protein
MPPTSLANERDVPQAHRREQLMHHRGELPLGAIGGGAAGRTDAWQVDGHRPRLPGSHGHHLLPRLPRLGPTVQEQEGQPVGVARLHHVQQRVGDRDVAVPESIIDRSYAVTGRKG